MLSISYHINRVLRFTPGTLSNIKLREYEEEKEMALYVGTNYHPHDWTPERWKKDIALMKEAGCEDGFTMELWTSSVQTNTEICQVIQEQLAAINIKAEISVQDANTIDTRIDAGDEFGMELHFYSCNSGHAEYTLSNILPTGMMRNDCRFSNAEYDKAYQVYQALYPSLKEIYKMANRKEG